VAGAALAVAGAEGVGHLLAEQLLAASERVLDIPAQAQRSATAAGKGDTNKNDPNDARSVPIAALRPASRRIAAADDHTAVLRMRSKCRRDLGRARTQVGCRLPIRMFGAISGSV
jgi:transposase